MLAEGPKFYYATGGCERGPVDLDALKKLAESGRIERRTPVRLDGRTTWYEARRVRGLARFFAAAPPPSRGSTSGVEIEKGSPLEPSSAAAPPDSEPARSPAHSRSEAPPAPGIAAPEGGGEPAPEGGLAPPAGNQTLRQQLPSAVCLGLMLILIAVLTTTDWIPPPVTRQKAPPPVRPIPQPAPVQDEEVAAPTPPPWPALGERDLARLERGDLWWTTPGDVQARPPQTLPPPVVSAGSDQADMARRLVEQRAVEIFHLMHPSAVLHSAGAWDQTVEGSTTRLSYRFGFESVLHEGGKETAVGFEFDDQANRYLDCAPEATTERFLPPPFQGRTLALVRLEDRLADFARRKSDLIGEQTASRVLDWVEGGATNRDGALVLLQENCPWIDAIVRFSYQALRISDGVYHPPSPAADPQVEVVTRTPGATAASFLKALEAHDSTALAACLSDRVGMFEESNSELLAERFIAARNHELPTRYWTGLLDEFRHFRYIGDAPNRGLGAGQPSTGRYSAVFELRPPGSRNFERVVINFRNSANGWRIVNLIKRSTRGGEPPPLVAKPSYVPDPTNPVATPRYVSADGSPLILPDHLVGRKFPIRLKPESPGARPALFLMRVDEVESVEGCGLESIRGVAFDESGQIRPVSLSMRDAQELWLNESRMIEYLPREEAAEQQHLPLLQCLIDEHLVLQFQRPDTPEPVPDPEEVVEKVLRARQARGLQELNREDYEAREHDRMAALDHEHGLLMDEELRRAPIRVINLTDDPMLLLPLALRNELGDRVQVFPERIAYWIAERLGVSEFEQDGRIDLLEHLRELARQSKYKLHVERAERLEGIFEMILTLVANHRGVSAPGVIALGPRQSLDLTDGAGHPIVNSYIELLCIDPRGGIGRKVIAQHDDFTTLFEVALSDDLRPPLSLIACEPWEIEEEVRYEPVMTGPLPVEIGLPVSIEGWGHQVGWEVLEPHLRDSTNHVRFAHGERACYTAVPDHFSTTLILPVRNLTDRWVMAELAFDLVSPDWFAFPSQPEPENALKAIVVLRPNCQSQLRFVVSQSLVPGVEHDIAPLLLRVKTLPIETEMASESTQSGPAAPGQLRPSAASARP